MTSLLRLKGRALQIGNYTLFTLTFLTAVMLIFAVSLLPVIYIRGAEASVGEYLGNYASLANLAFALFSYLFLLCIYDAMRIGIKRFFLKKAQRKNPTSQDIFFYFRPKNFFRCIFYCVRLGIIRLLVFLFCLSPCGACLFFVYNFSRSGVSALVCLSLFATAVCLFINGIFFYSSFFSSFFLCDYYFIDGSFVSFSHLVASSQKMMLHRKSLLMKLRFSFTGWFLLCTFLLPLPYVWSYYNQCLAVAAEDFMKGKKA